MSARWKNSAFCLLLAGILLSVSLLQTLSALFVSIADGRIVRWFPWCDQNLFVVLVTTFGLQLSIVVLVGAFLYAHRMSWKEAFGFGNGAIDNVLIYSMAYGVATVVVSLLLTGTIGTVLQFFGYAAEPQEVIQMLQDDSGHAMFRLLSLGFLSLGTAPIVEEILFRGILYGHLRDIGHRKTGLWLSAVVFGLVHANIIAFIPMVFLGVFFALLYDKYGNLLANITCHFTFNVINFTLCLLPAADKLL